MSPGAGVSTVVLAVTLVLMAVNLRAAVASVGPVLRELQLDLGMSDTLAGVLTTLPVVCFGAFGLLAGRFGRRVGTEPALVIALVLMTVGPVVRSLAPNAAWLLAASLVPLVGIAIGNVLAPVLVKAWFPDEVGRMTGWYSMAIAVGTALNAALTVPLASAFGGWRVGLGAWAIPAGLALLPWVEVARQRRRAARGREPGHADVDHQQPDAGRERPDSAPPPDPGPLIAPLVGPEHVVHIPPDRPGDPHMREEDRRDEGHVVGNPPDRPEHARTTRGLGRPAVHRQLKAWALAVFFGLQSIEAYTALGWLPAILQDAGLDAQRAGFYLAVAMFLGAPISLILPPLAARSADQRPWVVGLVVVSAVAYAGLIVAPAAAPLAWALLLGVGLGAFPLALVLIGLRSVTTAGTAALSSLAQGTGYLIAAMGPVTVGALRDLTGAWVVPLLVIVGLLVPKLVAGLIAATPGSVD